MLAAWLKKHYRIVWWLLFALLALPAALLAQEYYLGTLGLNPLETLMHTTGNWALVILLVSLAMTPLRRCLVNLSRHMHSSYGKRLSDWNWIIRLRRMIGLYSFFYAALHLLIFLHFDLDWDWLIALEETQEKPYILAGMLGFLLLLPLAITSHNYLIRRLGRNWRRLHRLVYAILIIVLLHFWWMMKVGNYTPLPYTVIGILLLGYRVYAQFGWVSARSVDEGMEVPERGSRG